MTWRRKEMDERSVERLLARVWRRLPAPSEDELQAVAQSARAEPGVRSAAEGGTERWSLRLRWTLAAAAVALLIGSGLGFGVGNSLTPSGSAGGNFVGFGFLPAQGWNVMQSGTLDEADEAIAIASNVPLEPSDDFEGAPLETIKLLPANSVVIFVTFSPRGDPAKDGAHPVREPPLRLGDADRLRPWYHVARYRLRAGIGGYNVTVRVFFGENAPSTRALEAAQSQLNRLAVAAERVTLRARPSIASTVTRVTLFGSVESGRAGEDVKIQAKDCGTDFFRVVAGAVTEAGGGWSTVYWLKGPTTTLRAIWNDAISAEVTVRKRASVHLKRRSANRFEVAAYGRLVWRKRVWIQRFDRRLGTWRAVKTVVLTDSVGVAQGQEAISIAEATFTVSLPKGTRVRAVFPRSQTGPCYVTGIRNPLTT